MKNKKQKKKTLFPAFAPLPTFISYLSRGEREEKGKKESEE